MTSKEAVLELICEAKSINIDEGRICFLRNIIEKDLNKLKQFEKENEELKEANKFLLNMSIDVHNEKEELKKAFDKACERLDWSCPTEQDLVDDFDCENCKDDYKECWKKYFLKDVLDNETKIK